MVEIEVDERSGICLLIEKHYHYGAAALLNSLVRCGYRGSVWIAYRGDLPPWTEGRLSDCSQGKVMALTEGITVYFHDLTTQSHFKYKKAEFMLRCEQMSPVKLERLFYFDADIVVIGEWSRFIDWTRNGIAVCEDIVTLHPSHPRKKGWRRFCEERQRPWTRDLDVYINSGFLGVSREHFGFIIEWDEIIRLMVDYLPDKDRRELDVPDMHIRRPDQDALNMALSCSHHPYSIVGRDGMGFETGGDMLAHAISPKKPWQTNFLIRTLKGAPPSYAEKWVEECLSGPVSPFTRDQLIVRHLNIRLASAIGRFYRSCG